jgi:hypothetical protein
MRPQRIDTSSDTRVAACSSSISTARSAALISLGATAVSYVWGVTAALAAGASDEEIVGVLEAVAPIVGLARTNAAALELAGALDVDIPQRRT